MDVHLHHDCGKQTGSSQHTTIPPSSYRSIIGETNVISTGRVVSIPSDGYVLVSIAWNSEIDSTLRRDETLSYYFGKKLESWELKGLKTERKFATASNKDVSLSSDSNVLVVVYVLYLITVIQYMGLWNYLQLEISSPMAKVPILIMI